MSTDFQNPRASARGAVKDRTHHDSGIITSSEVLAHYAEIALMYEELRAAMTTTCTTQER